MTTPAASHGRERAGLAFAVASAVFLASVVLIAKTLLKTMSPWLFTSYFFGFGAVAYVVYFVVRRDRRALEPAPGALTAGLVVGLVDVGYTLAYFYGLSILNPAVTAFLGHAGDVLAVMFGLVFLREVRTRSELAGIAIAFGGLALITARLDGIGSRGLAAMLTAAVFFAINAVLVKRYMRRYDPVTLSFYRTVVLAMAMIALSAAVLGLRLPRGDEWLLAIASGIVGPFLNYLCFYSALERLDVSRVNVIRVSYSVLVLLGAIFIYRQAPATRQIVGGLIVVAGIAWMVSARALLTARSARSSRELARSDRRP